jgi:hypothetical protein
VFCPVQVLLSDAAMNHLFAKYSALHQEDTKDTSDHRLLALTAALFRNPPALLIKD